MNTPKASVLPPLSQWNKPKRSLQSCATCNAWLANAAANPRHGQPRLGWCRAAPPMVMETVVPSAVASLSPTAGPQMQRALQGVWPPANSDGWCRAWEAQDDE